MIQVVYRERTPNRKAWKRFFVTIKGGTGDNEIGALDFGEPVRNYSGEGEVALSPVQDELYVLAYLMVKHPMQSYPTVQMVIDSIPEIIKSRVDAIEWCHGFYDFCATNFLDLAEKEEKWVTFVTLLTKENTGKDLPGVKLRFERPINLTDDAEWEKLARDWKDRFLR